MNGSAIYNPTIIKTGVILRDHEGKLIYAFAALLGFGTNNTAEVKAA